MRTGTEVWTYNTDLKAQERSWVGYNVHATDGDIGKIDEMSAKTSRGSLVVDTGFWIFGKKRLIPAASVRSVDHQNKIVRVSLTKDQIKNAPDYDQMRREQDDYLEEYGNYYGRYL